MKIVLIDGKKVVLYFWVVIMIIFITTFGYFFRNRIKYTSLIQSEITSLKEYSALNKKVTYKLPSKWITEEKNLGSKEIIYHNEFYSDEQKLHGFVQIWNLNMDLKEFIDNSKIISEQQNIIMSYTIQETKANKITGYKIEYVIKTKENSNYRATEYFLKINNEFIRFSFFIRNEDYNNALDKVYDYIVNTVSYY